MTGVSKAAPPYNVMMFEGGGEERIVAHDDPISLGASILLSTFYSCGRNDTGLFVVKRRFLEASYTEFSDNPQTPTVWLYAT